MCAGWRAPASPRIKGPIQMLVMHRADLEVCLHGWMDRSWGPNLSWPWPRALVRIRRGPREPQEQSRWPGLGRRKQVFSFVALSKS